jgi:linoleoyl-CoA desaturase
MIYQRSDDFAAALREAVEGHFRQTGRSMRGDWRMRCKAVVLLLLFAGTYGFLCFAAQRAWQAVPLALLLGLCMAGLGFNVAHDGNHGAFGRSRRTNRIAALALDLVGGSSWLWRVKHNAAHHAYPNIDGFDDDVTKGPLARLSPCQIHRPWHRYQHLYLWSLYFLLGMKWHLVSDFVALYRGRIAQKRFSPSALEVAAILICKLLFFSWAFIVPALFHPIVVVLAYYAVAAGTLGITTGIIFQLAHCVPNVQFFSPPPPEATGLPHDFAEHQVRTTSNFACESKLLSMLIGGLNFQIEHHLFPRISHIHYPALRPLVKAICARFSIPYCEHPSFSAAVRAHGQWLLAMGRPLPAIKESTS